MFCPLPQESLKYIKTMFLKHSDSNYIINTSYRVMFLIFISICIHILGTIFKKKKYIVFYFKNSKKKKNYRHKAKYLQALL